MPYFKCTTNTVHQHHQNPHTSKSSQKSDRLTRPPQHKVDTPPLQATVSLYHTNHIHPSLLCPLPNIIPQKAAGRAGHGELDLSLVSTPGLWWAVVSLLLFFPSCSASLASWLLCGDICCALPLLLCCQPSLGDNLHDSTAILTFLPCSAWSFWSRWLGPTWLWKARLISSRNMICRT